MPAPAPCLHHAPGLTEIRGVHICALPGAWVFETTLIGQFLTLDVTIPSFVFFEFEYCGTSRAERYAQGEQESVKHILQKLLL